VNASQLSHLEYVAGADGSSDQIQVSVFDGAVWSAPASMSVAAGSGTVDVSPIPIVLGTAPGQVLDGGPGNAFIASYAGNDLISAVGHDIVALNYGGGQDTIAAAPGA